MVLEPQDIGASGAFRGLSGSETTLTLSQLIELGGKRTERVKAATLERDLAGWDYETRRIEVFARTAEAFVEVLSRQQRLALAEETVRLAEEIVQAVSKRVEAARTFEVERTKAQVAVAAAQIERDQTQRALTAARQRLAANWDNTQPRFERVEGDLESLIAVPAQEQLLARLKQNPELARWATELLQREARLKVAKSKRIPDLTVGGGYRRLSGPEDNALVFGVSVPLPLFNKNQGGIKEAEYRVAKAREEQRAVDLRLTTELGQASQQVSAAAAEIAALKEKLLPGAQQTYTTISQYYAEGRLKVKLNETRMAHLVPRFPGVVTAIRHKLGDTVKAGEVMAVIESNESLVPYELKSLVDGTVIKSTHRAGRSVGNELPAVCRG